MFLKTPLSRRSLVAPVPPAEAQSPGLVLSSDTNVIVHANSYYALWTYPAIDNVGELKSVLEAHSAPHSNFAIPGTTFSMMRLSTQHVVKAFDPAKRNILICGEARNECFSVSPPRTTHQLVDATRRYIASVQADVFSTHGKYFDYVVLCGTIPSQGEGLSSSDIAVGNTALAKYDEHFSNLDNLAGVGADAFVSFRQHSPQYFALRGGGKGGFMAPGTCLESKEGEYIHPTGEARDAFASAIAKAITLNLT